MNSKFNRLNQKSVFFEQNQKRLIDYFQKNFSVRHKKTASNATSSVEIDLLVQKISAMKFKKVDIVLIIFPDQFTI